MTACNSEGIRTLRLWCHVAIPVAYFIVSGGEASSLLAYLGSHRSVFYLAVVRLTLKGTLYMEAVVVPPLSVFVGDEYLQNGESEWNGAHRLS